MSEGGLFVETLVFAPVGTRIELSVKLFGHRYDVPVEVAWILYDGENTAIGFGARFLELRRPVRRVIGEFMRARAPMPFELLELEDDAEEAPHSPRVSAEGQSCAPPPLLCEEEAPPPPIAEEASPPMAESMCRSGAASTQLTSARRRRTTQRFAARRGRVGPPPLPVAGRTAHLEKAASDAAAAGVDSDRMVN